MTSCSCFLNYIEIGGPGQNTTDSSVGRYSSHSQKQIHSLFALKNVGALKLSSNKAILISHGNTQVACSYANVKILVCSFANMKILA